MSSLDARRLALLLSPVAAVFLWLGLTGILSVKAAILSGVVAAAGIAVIAYRIRTVENNEALAEYQVHEALREAFVSQARIAESFEMILDSVPIPVIVLRGDRHVLQANQAAVKLLGADPIDLDLTAVMRHPRILAAIEHVLGKGGTEAMEEFAFGGGQHVVARVVRLRPRDPSGPAALLVLEDLTTLYQIEQVQSDFVANVSHELRTPLATLIGFIETLRGPAHDDEEARDEFLALMESQAARMSRLVADLLSLSRIEANEFVRPDERVRIDDVLRTVARMLEHEAAERAIDIVVDLEDGLPDVIGDSDQLTQVFQNLIDNAIKYGREHSEVRVTARRTEGERVTVSVMDHGEGLAPEQIPRLTERFYRVDKARSRAMGGTGLGLAIVKHILNRHRTRLSVHSAEGVGSTFSVSLAAATTS